MKSVNDLWGMRTEKIDPALLRYAEILYVKHNKSYAEIATEIDFPEQLIVKFIEENYLDEKRKSNNVSPRKSMKLLHTMLDDAIKKFDPTDITKAKEFDQILKYTAAIKNLETGVTLTDIVDVFEVFILWLLPIDHELTKQFSLKLNEFINHRLKIEDD